MLFTMVWEIPQNSQTPCCEMIQVYCFDTSYIEQASQSGLKKTLWLAKFDGPATTTIGGSMGRDKPPKVIASSDLTFSGHLPLLNRPQPYFSLLCSGPVMCSKQFQAKLFVGRDIRECKGCANSDAQLGWQ